MRIISIACLLLSAAAPTKALEARTVWKKDLTGGNITGWGVRKISSSDFIVAGSNFGRSIVDTAKLFILRLKENGETVWLREYNDPDVSGWMPKTGGMEILTNRDGTYTLVSPVKDSSGTFGIGVYLFNDVGDMISQKTISKGYDFVNFAYNDGNVFALGIKSGRVAGETVGIPVLLKYDRQMRVLDSLYLRDSVNCRSESGFTTGDALSIRNDTLHVVGNQDCTERTNGMSIVHLSKVYATLDTNLKILGSRKFAAAEARDHSFSFKGIMPHRSGAIVYGGFSGTSPRQVVAFVDHDSLQWKTEFRSQYHYDDRAGIVGDGKLLWCGYHLDCRLFDTHTGRQMDSTVVTPGFSEHGRPLRSLQWDDTDFIVVSGSMQTARVRFELPTASVQRKHASRRIVTGSLPSLINGRWVAKKDQKRKNGMPHEKLRPR
jgi:hypothetical protein